MRIRSNLYVSLDGYVSAPDGRPVQLQLPTFTGADSHGLPDFLADCEAVLMGRTTFLPALGAPRWPWTQPVFVLTSSELPDGTPDDVSTAPTASALLERMESAGVTGDVHLVGGPSTLRAFHAIGALDELRLHVVPMLLGTGAPLFAGCGPLPLTLRSSRAFPDGVVELAYAAAGNRRSA
jgi:dihydrofolate reductase